ncbi:MAG: hypothetical protein WBW03_25540 [Silvibacterium sp.]
METPEGTGPFTAFGPTNEAFDKLPAVTGAAPSERLVAEGCRASDRERVSPSPPLR